MSYVSLLNQVASATHFQFAATAVDSVNASVNYQQITGHIIRSPLLSTLGESAVDRDDAPAIASPIAIE